ncbi:MAG: hypothetical protein GX962_16665 [Epulopiscium sp.]|nr:hypothetical protein [Candidatus Epulonipiscium sp.]
MFKNDLIDKKIQALLDYEKDYFDETVEGDLIYYCEIRDFAEEHGGLLFFFHDRTYLIINFIDEEDFLIIPVDYSL